MLGTLMLAAVLGAAPVATGTDAVTVVDPNGALSGSGRIDILGVITSHKDQLKLCSDPHWKTTAEPRRRLTIDMHWVINPDGHVSSVASPSDSPVATCLKAAVTGWTFAAGLDKKPLRVDFPFSFDPPGGLVEAPPAMGAGQQHAEIQQVISQHLDQVKACIAPQLQTRPELKALGQVEMHWAIELNGNVTDARCTTQALQDTPMAACLQATISGWTFPPRLDAKRLQIDMPFRFDGVTGG